MTKGKKKKKRPNHDGFGGRTLIGFVLDKSASMRPLTDATIDGFNDWLFAARIDNPAARFDLTLFATNAEYPVRDAALSTVKPIDARTYVADGASTALYDAIGDTVRALREKKRAGDRVLVPILTDGKENDSRRYDRTTVAELVQGLENEGDWTFVYLSASPSAFADAAAINVQRGNTAHFVATPDGTQTALHATTAATRTFLQSDSAQSSGFYTPTVPVTPTTGGN